MYFPPVVNIRRAHKSRDVRCLILFASWRWRRSISRQVAVIIAALDQLMRQPMPQRKFVDQACEAPRITMYYPPVANIRRAHKSRDVRCFILFASWRWRRSFSRQVAVVIAALDQLMRQPMP